MSATFERPRTAFTAAMAGLVWAAGEWTQGALALADGQRLDVSSAELTTGTRAAGALDPRSVTLAPPGTASAIRDTVRALEPRCDGTLRVRGSLLWADVLIAKASHFLPRVGEPVHFDVTARPRAFSLES